MTSVLITSGGTAVPIDPVRYIGNMSSGRLGSEIARSALIAGLEVTYLAAKNARSPFCHQVDYNAFPNLPDHLNQIQAIQRLHQRHHHHYKEIRYHTYDEYADHMHHIISKQQPDIIILAAAVSDYLIENYSAEKIKSTTSLNIKLKTAPKIINAVREWAPNAIIVGFKLLVNSDEVTLIKTAQKSIEQNKLDLCIANDLTSVKSDTHTIIMIDRDGGYQHHSTQLGTVIIDACLRKVTK